MILISGVRWRLGRPKSRWWLLLVQNTVRALDAVLPSHLENRIAKIVLPFKL